MGSRRGRRGSRRGAGVAARGTTASSSPPTPRTRARATCVRRSRAWASADLVDDVVSSRDVGVAKPDPFFYRAALLRAGPRRRPPAGRERAVMVGDSWANDVEGARRAGLRAVWFNRARASPAGRRAAPPDAEISAARPTCRGASPRSRDSRDLPEPGGDAAGSAADRARATGSVARLRPRRVGSGMRGGGGRTQSRGGSTMHRDARGPAGEGPGPPAPHRPSPGPPGAPSACCSCWWPSPWPPTSGCRSCAARYDDLNSGIGVPQHDFFQYYAAGHNWRPRARPVPQPPRRRPGHPAPASRRSHDLRVHLPPQRASAHGAAGARRLRCRARRLAGPGRRRASPC